MHCKMAFAAVVGVSWPELNALRSSVAVQNLLSGFAVFSAGETPVHNHKKQAQYVRLSASQVMSSHRLRRAGPHVSMQILPAKAAQA